MPSSQHGQIGVEYARMNGKTCGDKMDIGGCPLRYCRQARIDKDRLVEGSNAYIATEGEHIFRLAFFFLALVLWALSLALMAFVVHVDSSGIGILLGWFLCDYIFLGLEQFGSVGGMCWGCWWDYGFGEGGWGVGSGGRWRGQEWELFFFSAG